MSEQGEQREHQLEANLSRSSILSQPGGTHPFQDSRTFMFTMRKEPLKKEEQKQRMDI